MRFISTVIDFLILLALVVVVIYLVAKLYG